MPEAHFGNTVNDKIGVNLNEDIGAIRLSPRALDATKSNYTIPIASFDIKANSGKGQFGGGAGVKNNVQITYGSLRKGSAYYTIEVDSSVAGQDLFFYIFLSSLVGQDQSGRDSGITIKETDATFENPV